METFDQLYFYQNYRQQYTVIPITTVRGPCSFVGITHISLKISRRYISSKTKWNTVSVACYSSKMKKNLLQKYTTLLPLYIIRCIWQTMLLITWASTQKKPVFRSLQTSQAQTSLHIRPVWSAPLWFFYGKYHMLTCYRWKFNFLASLCSCWGDWFETCYVKNPEGRFSHKKIHIMIHMHRTTLQFWYYALWAMW